MDRNGGSPRARTKERMIAIQVNDKVSVSGGVEVYIQDLVGLLRKEGISSKWVSLTRNGPEVRLQHANNDKAWIGRIDELNRSSLGVRRTDNVVLHVHSISDPVLMEALFQIAPVVRTMHDPRMVCPGQGKFWTRQEKICDKPFSNKCLVRAYTKKCCNRHPIRLIKQFQNTHYEKHIAAGKYGAILANSSYSRQLLEELEIGGQNVHTCHYFTEPVEPELENADIRHSIVYVGRLSNSKGVHYLLRAFANVIEKLPSTLLEIYGSGQHEKELLALSRELNLCNHVSFNGWADRERVSKAIDSATIVAFPSIYPEAFGIVGIEAMVRGKPVVAFKVGGVGDWLEDGVTGYSVPVKNISELANGMVRLLHDDVLRQKMGSRAKRVALETFSTKSHVQKLSKIYRDILKIE